MRLHRLRNKLTNALGGSLAGEFKIGLTIAVVLFVSNLVYSAYTVGFENGFSSAVSREYTVSGDNNFMTRLRIATSFGLLVCGVGLAFRSLFGMVASMLGITWLGLIYGWWYYKSLAFLRNLEVTDFSSLPDISHAVGLWGATWWDLLVFAVSAILFVWQLAILIRVVKAPDEELNSAVRIG